MDHKIESLESGRVELHRYSGVVSNEIITGLIEGRAEALDRPAVRVFIVDVSDASFEDLDTDRIREIAKLAVTTRKEQEDSRPTLIVAPDALIRGLSNMMSGYRGDDIQFAFKSLDDPLAWARDHLANQDDNT